MDDTITSRRCIIDVYVRAGIACVVMRGRYDGIMLHVACCMLYVSCFVQVCVLCVSARTSIMSHDAACTHRSAAMRCRMPSRPFDMRSYMCMCMCMCMCMRCRSPLACMRCWLPLHADRELVATLRLRRVQLMPLLLMLSSSHTCACPCAVLCCCCC